MDKNQIAKMMDHTILKPNATIKDIEVCCEQAKTYGFHSVCINPYFVKSASQWLDNSNVKVCTVVGFPLGANITKTKVLETKLAILDGAVEIDMVINIAAIKDSNFKLVENDIEEVVSASEGKIVKVILETCFLTEKEKELACNMAVKAGAAFVKTSTGFGTGGALVNDINLMRRVVGKDIGVKASGGIKTLSDVINMINAGANRIGTSSGVSIIKECC